MYTLTSQGIRITVEPEAVEDLSEPHNKRFAFRFRVQIENLADQPVRIWERYWLVKSGGLRIAELVGPAFEDEQPELDSGDVLEFVSETVLRDPFGSLEGNYYFRNASGKFFEAPVPKFDLVYPLTLH